MPGTAAAHPQAAHAVSLYEQWVGTQPLSDRTRKAYLWQVQRYVDWVTAAGDPTHPAIPDTIGQPSPAGMEDTAVVEWLVRDYKEHLLAAGAAATTVNQALSAVGSFYLSAGYRARVPGVRIPAHAPKALSPTETRRIRRFAAKVGPRDRAIVVTFLDCGLRLSELAALNVGDAVVSARKGRLTVRVGKGGHPRTVPLTPENRRVIAEWVPARGGLEARTDEDRQALWLSRLGRRLSKRAIQTVVGRVGAAAGVDRLHPHRLRHTYITRLARGGADPYLIATMAGHTRLETTMLYSRPDQDTAERAVLRILGEAAPDT